jgi:ribosomal protein S18 acetylase RimI-like enzyme
VAPRQSDAASVIRPAEASDRPGILRIVRAVVEDGTTYAFAADTSDRELLEYWPAPGDGSFVATRGDLVVGCYVLRPNQPGRGGHVANASYAVLSEARGRGVGHAMGLHSLDEARRRGFQAMQFNFVVASNERAIALWRRLGFQTVGRLPRAFAHPGQGLVDALVMHRFL